MKKLMLGILIAFSFSACSQTITDWIKIKNYVTLNNYKITGIANDTPMTDISQLKVPTEYAVYWFVKNRIGVGGGNKFYFEAALSDTSTLSPNVGDALMDISTAKFYKRTGYWKFQTTLPRTVTGTANQINASSTTGDIVVSFPNDVTVNNSLKVPSANITKFSNLPTNGFMKTSGSDGTVSIDLNTYLTTAVQSLTGTAHQVSVSASTGAVTVSLPNDVTINNSLYVPSADIAKFSNLPTNGFMKTSGSDGTVSIDNSTYALSSALASYLPLAGGSMGGSILDGTNNTHDIGGASNKFRFGYFGTAVISPTINGSTSAGGSLTLVSSTNISKGSILFGTSAYDEVTDRLGITITSPTARLHLPAGTTSASTAPLKFNSGTLMTSPEPGAVEYDGTNFWITDGASARTKLASVAAGTTNRVAYYNGSSVLTSTANWTFDGTKRTSIKTFTAAANGEYGDLFYGSLTARATASDTLIFDSWQPRFVAGANNQTFAAIDVKPYLTTGAFTGLKNYGVRVLSAFAGPCAYFGTSTVAVLAGTMSSTPGLWSTYVTPSSSNPFIYQDSGGETYINAATGSDKVIIQTGGASKVYFDSDKIGIGVVSPLGMIHFQAGNNIGRIPMRFSSGSLQTSSIPTGAIEYSTNAYVSNDKLNRFPLGGAIYQAYTDANNTSTTETDLFTYTTKANTLFANGENLKANYVVSFTDATATAQLRIYFGGTLIGDTGALTVSSTGSANVDVLIIRTGSTTARAMVTINAPTTSTAVYTALTDITGLTLTSTNIIKITGTAGGAGGGSNDIVGKMAMLYWAGAVAN